MADDRTPGGAGAAGRPGLRLEVAGGTATIRIDNPAKRNAMTVPMWRQLPVLLDRLAADPGVRVLVLTGAGDTFCAGADIGTLDELLGIGPLEGTGPVRADGPAGSTEDGQAAMVVAENHLAAFPKPTIAEIRGHCVGGGCQLAVACDLRIAAEGTRFGVPPARLGVVYPLPTTRRLVELVGPAAAKYLLYSAELVDTAHAARIGLVDEVVPADRLADRVRALAATLADRSLLTQSAAKEYVALASAARYDGGTDPGAGADRVAYWEREMRTAGDLTEGVAAFHERRPPIFSWSPHDADPAPGNPGRTPGEPGRTSGGPGQTPAG
ncbi:enoyl-CoA hydratase/isomerase family protein [Polymorphospora rubra]|uniref:enoyl-CoA hydratase/isomerase family protein n=1 Tax=Polymorphospora rubra TaxID=338584 RepID=UPI0033ED8E2B